LSYLKNAGRFAEAITAGRRRAFSCGQLSCGNCARNALSKASSLPAAIQ
jgi:hypothetical protein